MEKFLYCDSCFLITFFQDGKLGSLAQYKDRFFTSETQIIGELYKPDDLPSIVRKTISIIPDDREEIIDKTTDYALEYKTLTYFDCLCMAYGFLDGYCLITDDKALEKKCAIHNIEVKTSKDIEVYFLCGGNTI